jgi:hypothetical protein
MAIQDGLIKLKGIIGDLTFYRTADGYVARRKGGITRERIKRDPAFERTRENIAEFGRAGEASRLFRHALRCHLAQVRCGRLNNRLTASFLRVIKADAINVRGKRNVKDGSIGMLKGFEFSATANLGQSLKVQFNSRIDRASGAMDVSIPVLVPRSTIIAPVEATHYKLKSVGLEVDFENKKHVTASAESETVALTNEQHEDVVLSQRVTANSTHPLFLMVGISYYLQSNKQLYPLKNGEYNALSIVAAEGVVAG